jgi:hypothetical protein
MTHPWDELETSLPQPGEVVDRCLGIDGPAELLPENDAETEEDE